MTGPDDAQPGDLDGPARGEVGRVALVAEDARVVREMIVSLLTTDGWEVHATDTGANVVQLLDDHHPVLCLLDIMMPGLDGVDAMADARRAGHGPDDGTVFIMLTALDGDEDVRRGVLAGADDYITKPFDVTDLTDRAARWCSAAGWELVDPADPGVVHEHLLYTGARPGGADTPGDEGAARADGAADVRHPRAPRGSG